MSGSFLEEATMTPGAQALYDEDIASDGFVWNTTRVWAHQPDTQKHLFDLMAEALEPSGLTFRDRGILVSAAASTMGDSYCSLAWGGRLAKAATPEVAASVLGGQDEGLTEAEAAMAAWARKVVRDPNSTTPDDVRQMHDAGFSDAQIFSITVYVALRLAASTINDALGAHPDAKLVATLPPEVVGAVSYGRAAAE